MAFVYLHGIHTELTGYSKMTNQAEITIRNAYCRNKNY